MVKQFLEKQRQIYQTAGFLSIPGRMNRVGAICGFRQRRGPRGGFAGTPSAPAA